MKKLKIFEGQQDDTDKIIKFLDDNLMELLDGNDTIGINLGDNDLSSNFDYGKVKEHIIKNIFGHLEYDIEVSIDDEEIFVDVTYE